MTLKELQNKIERTMGKELPTAAFLRAGNSPLVASKDFDGNTQLSVFRNGFALYICGRAATVFRVDYCGGYTYFGREEQTELSEDFFAETDWWVRLLMEGEDRLTHNRNVMIEKYESYFENDYEAYCEVCSTEQSVCDALEQREIIDKAFAILTQRQREVVTMFYLDGLCVKEIAAFYGISHQAVTITLSDVRRKFEKNRKNFKLF